MFNLEVRNAIKQSRVFGYEVASELKMSESAFSRMLARKELPSDKKEKILVAIENIKKAP